MSITIHVNGARHEVVADPGTPLLLVLRNDFGLNAAKFGCGLGRCGACTVLREGKAIHACEVPVGELDGARITTLEGLPEGARGVGCPGGQLLQDSKHLHPLQQAFLDEQAAQCGYCSPGIVMTAAALLGANPHPTEHEIRAALAGTLCRCGAHARILKAIRRVAAGEPGSAPTWPMPPRAASTEVPAGDGLIRIAPDGGIVVLTGKVELGTGVATALAQLVADELDVPAARVTTVMGDTALTPDQGTTAGSKTIQVTGVRYRQDAANLRRALLIAASTRMEVSPADLETVDGGVRVVGQPDRTIPYQDLAREIAVDPDESPAAFMTRSVGSAIGVSAPRVDLPAKLTGGDAFIHDLRLPGMLHGRVVRPHRRITAGIGGRVVEVDASRLNGMPGIVAVVRRENFVGVVAEREEQAIEAAQAIRIRWEGLTPLPDQDAGFERLRHVPATIERIVQAGNATAEIDGAALVHRATYRQAWQAHASMGPSCGVADVGQDAATVWSSSQHVHALAPALAPLIGLAPSQVRVIYREGSGCYGQNGSEDASADAAILSHAVGKPVRVQWSRQDEFAWEPKGPAMLSDLAAGLDASGRIVGWRREVFTPTHSNRPGGDPARLLAGQLVDPSLVPVPRRNGGGNRNAPCDYAIPDVDIAVNWVPETPIHQSSLRSLGGFHNATANEIFMDELAHLSGSDPVAFRLRHLDDRRAIAVIEAASARAGWGEPLVASDGIRRGRGIAYARYENEYAYVATVAEVAVAADTGEIRVERAIVAHDCGLIVNPDGVRNQVEGNTIQGISRALYEEVTWDVDGITSLTWREYRILGFPEAPEIEVVLIDRPDEPPLGAGEPAICTAAAAVSNAVFAATGIRLRDVPFRVTGR